MLRCCGYVCSESASCLTRAAAEGSVNVVDLYNSVTGTWSTAQLSVAQVASAAASVGNVALFAGGVTLSALLCRERGGDGVFMVSCVLSALRVLQCFCSVCPATACSLMRATAVDISNVVDVYNSATGTWLTAQLSVARYGLAAASVGNVALFAGGQVTSALLCRDGVEVVLWLRAC